MSESSEDGKRTGLKSETFVFQDGGSHAVESDPESGAGQVRYRVGSELGRGGLGEVHSATDLLLERQVAMKASIDENPGALDRFWHEARVTAVLDHPNIVPIYDAGMLGEQPFFTMKQIEGRNLADAVYDGPAMSLRERLDIFRSVCDAIEYAHAKRWLHRDLKPENVMLGPFGEVLVVDWGIAASLDGEAPPLAGTPRYMAPEQARGDALDVRADVYALGSVLWFLLSGEDPFPDMETKPIIKTLRSGQGYEIPDTDAIPAELLAIVSKALQGEPRQRYPTVRALKEDVLAFVDGAEVSAVEYTAAQRLAKWADRHRRRLLVGLGGSTLVLGFVGVAGLSAGLVMSRSAEVARSAASRAQSAESETREQLVEALVAGAAAHVAGDRYGQARHALEQADEAGEHPFSGLAWADLTTRGVWPIAEVDTDGATPADIALGPSFALLTRSDGTWETRDLMTGALRTEGTVPGRPIVVVDARRIVSVDGPELVLVDVFDGELARVQRERPDVRIEAAWRAGDRILVQAYQDGLAPPVTAWSIPELDRLSVPAALEDLYVQGVGPWGNTALGSSTRRPDTSLAGEVRSIANGRTVASVDRLQAFLGREVLYEVRNRVVRARSIATGELLWERMGFPGIEGAETRSGIVAVADGEGRVLVLDGRTGEERALLLGLDERPVDVQIDRSGQWVFAAGVEGRLASWRLPETPTGWWAGQVRAIDAHPEGRLALVDGSTLQIVDVPSATVVASIPYTGQSAWAEWSPDGRRIAYSSEGRLQVVDAATLEPVEIAEVAGGIIGWGSEQLVVASTREGIVRLDPDTLVVKDRFDPMGAFWDVREGPDGELVFAANKRGDEGVGARVPGDGPPELLARGGSPETVGFGLARLDDVWLFARQDGRIARSRGDEALAPWRWQAGALLGLEPVEGGLIAVGYDGRIHAIDGSGRARYALEYTSDPLFAVEQMGDVLVVSGVLGLRTLPLDGRLADDTQSKLLAAHAWSELDADALSPEDRLTVALGRGEGVDEALEGRDDAVAAILRGALERR